MKYTHEILEPLVRSSTTVAEVGRKLGLSPRGGNMTYLKKCIIKFGISMEHFVNNRWTTDSRRRLEVHRLSAEQILVKTPRDSYRTPCSRLTRALLETGRPYKCEHCHLDGTWNAKPITLHVDHINGDSWNNEANNLRFLCPNCHAQTPTHNRPKHAIGKPPTSEVGHVVAARWSSQQDKSTRTCCDCRKEITAAADRCLSCAAKHRPSRPGKHKIVWPDKDTLLLMVSESSYFAVGRQLGVSDNAVRKHLHST